jgi:hypothetical protein
MNLDDFIQDKKAKEQAAAAEKAQHRQKIREAKERKAEQERLEEERYKPVKDKIKKLKEIFHQHGVEYKKITNYRGFTRKCSYHIHPLPDEHAIKTGKEKYSGLKVYFNFTENFYGNRRGVVNLLNTFTNVVSPSEPPPFPVTLENNVRYIIDYLSSPHAFDTQKDTVENCPGSYGPDNTLTRSFSRVLAPGIQIFRDYEVGYQVRYKENHPETLEEAHVKLEEDLTKPRDGLHMNISSDAVDKIISELYTPPKIPFKQKFYDFLPNW